MKSRIAVAAFGGFALAASASGATHALTMMPAWLEAAVGVVCLYVAAGDTRVVRDRTSLLVTTPGRELRSRRAASFARTLRAALAGTIAGALLPAQPQAPTGPIVTHTVARHERGDLFELLDRLDADPRSVLGRRVIVTGEWTPPSAGRPASVSRRVMTCCAADTVAVGFDVTGPNARARPNEWVTVAGTLTAKMELSEVRYRIERAKVSAVGATPSAR